MDPSPIYLDNNATTPVDPRVARAIRPVLEENFGNPSSAHSYGRKARAAVTRAREQVAELLGCSADEIVFTSGASESNNLALKGAAFHRRGGHILTSSIEHPSVLGSCRFLEDLGFARTTLLPVDATGRVQPDQVAEAVGPDTILVSIMHSNNEIGTLQPIEEIAAWARERGVLFHVDAAQSIGKVPVRVRELGVDLLSVAGHKFYAPKGIGALYVREKSPLSPLIHGAGHERGRRAGTENVPYIVGLGEACRLAGSDLEAETQRLRQLRDRLWERLSRDLKDRVVLNGHPQLRLPNTLSLNFVGTTGAELLSRCPEVAASTGPACHDGVVRLSHVLEATGVSPELGKGAVRLSLGRFTAENEVDRAAASLARAFHESTAAQASP
ncbi:MAG: cysteine desulfurase [Armatimonadetes bacterium]|nr:cysteine desulfurase [Armatimonadota bacterium]